MKSASTKSTTTLGSEVSVSVTLGLLLLNPIVLHASDPAADFRFDPVEHWAARILTATLVAAVVLVSFALVAVVRAELNGRAGRSIMAVGVVILPSISVAIGMLLVFVRAGSVEFCASCHHVMQPYVDDMKDPTGTGIAAVHFANQYIPGDQCYECHTSYGLFGTFEAKLHGIGEVYRYYTQSYSRPIEMWQPYSNGDCLKCHASSKKWLAVDAHTDGGMRDHLFADRSSCMSCHEPGHMVRDAVAGGSS